MRLPQVLEDRAQEASRTDRGDCRKVLQPPRDFLYLGRGINYPIALEGALKLKEISYIHAEAIRPAR